MTASRNLLRVLDANSNRAREALRVCEDLVRFAPGPASPERSRGFAEASPASAFRALRTLRQHLNAQLRRLPVSAAEAVRARDSVRDPGRGAASGSVKSVEHLLLINLQRAKEALRVLEECCRLLAPRQARRFQSLRFRTYDVERDLLLRLAALRDRGSRRRARP